MLLYIFEGWNRKLHEASEDFTWVVVFLKRLVVWRCEVTVWERLRPSGAQRHYSDQINNSFTDLFLYLFCRSLSCSALQLVTWIGFRVHSPCCNGPVCANATGCVCVCVVVHLSCILFVTQSTGWEVGGETVPAWPSSCYFSFGLFWHFYFTLILFIFAHHGHPGALSLLCYTHSNPLTSADNVNCLPPAGDTALCEQRTPSHRFPLSSFLFFTCKRSSLL